MDTVINKLSEIEVAASRILDGAASQKKALEQQQEERIAEYDRQIDEKTAAEIEKLRQELSVARDSELKQLQENSARTLDELDAYYQENHEVLAGQIYEKILRK